MANRKNTFLLKRSNVAGKAPAAGDLQLGELAINTADVILFASGTTSNSILPIGWDRVARTGDTMTGSLYAPSISATTVSATTYLNLPSSTFTGGTVSGATNFTNGLTANTMSATTYYGDGSNLTGISAVATEFVVNCRNQSGSNMYRGQVVYMNGSTGNKPTILLAQANSEMTSARTFGVLKNDIANNADGDVVTIGSITNLDTRTTATHPFTNDTLSDGQTIYLSPTNAGYITNVKPYAPNHLVYIGKVVRTSPTNGYIEYQIQNGYELDELHDVKITGVTYGDLLTYSAYNGSNVWVNTKTLNGSYTITGDTTVGGQMKASSVSATTYYNLPIDVRVTGSTYDNNTFTFTNNTGGTFNVLFNSVTGLTSTGTILSSVLSATTISATTYYNLPADLWTQNGTSIYYNTGNVGIGTTNPSRKFEVVDGTSLAYFNLTGTSGPAGVVINTDYTKLARFIAGDGINSISVGMRTSGETASPGFGGQNDAFIYVNTTANGLNIINAQSTGNSDYIRLYAGLIANQGTSHLHVQGSGSTKGFIGINTENPIARLHVSGDTLISGGLTATTISATTYFNLPTDIRVTGGTYSSGITTFINNTGGTFTVTGFSTGNTTLYLYAESSTAPSVGPIVNGLSSIAMGDSAKALSDYMFVYGYLAGNGATGTTNSSFIGYRAGYQASDAIYSNFIGRQAGDNSTNLTDSNFMGRGAGLNATGSSYSNFVGSSAGQNATGATYSNFIGRQAGQDATVLTSSNFIGTLAGVSVNTANYSNFIGHQAGYSASSVSYSNFIGFQAGRDTTGVTYSNLFGYYAGETFVGNNIGSNNIIIGTNISLPNATANGINIGGVLFGTNTYSTTTGNPSITPTSTGRIGIGVVTPSERLHVSGNILNWGNLTVTGNTYLQAISGTSATLSGSGQSILTVIGSGNSTSSPIFSIQGSSGELFSVTDSLTGSLFSVNDISGLPIVEVFSDNTMLVGSYQAPALNTTVKTILTAGTNTIYSIPTSAYTGSFIDYTVISTGATGARAGTIMSIWSGTTVQYTDVSTNDIGTTAGITFSVSVVGSNAVISSSATTAGWTLKTIIRSI